MIILVVTGWTIVIELGTETLIFIFVDLDEENRFVIVDDGRIIIENIRIQWLVVILSLLIGIIVLIGTEIFFDKILIFVTFIIITD